MKNLFEWNLYVSHVLIENILMFKTDKEGILNCYELWYTDEKGNTHLQENYKEKYSYLFDFDVIFTVGLFDEAFFKLVQIYGIKIIYVMLGSIYHNDIHSMVDEKFPSTDNSFLYDEIWISPHFKYCQEYYKIRFNCEKVL